MRAPSVLCSSSTPWCTCAPLAGVTEPTFYEELKKDYTTSYNTYRCGYNGAFKQVCLCGAVMSHDCTCPRHRTVTRDLSSLWVLAGLMRSCGVTAPWGGRGSVGACRVRVVTDECGGRVHMQTCKMDAERTDGSTVTNQFTQTWTYQAKVRVWWPAVKHVQAAHRSHFITSRTPRARKAGGRPVQVQGWPGGRSWV